MDSRIHHLVGKNVSLEVYDDREEFLFFVDGVLEHIVAHDVYRVALDDNERELDSYGFIRPHHNIFVDRNVIEMTFYRGDYQVGNPIS